MDVPERIHAGLAKLGMPQRMSGVVATEFSILYYAIAAWTRSPFILPQSRAFSYHKKNPLVATLYTVLATAVIELAALELLLRVRRHVAANVCLGVDALAVLWILGYTRSVQLRPNKGMPGYLRATFGQPNVMITLTEPLVAAGEYGVTRTVTRVGLSVDDPSTFSLALTPTPA